MSSIVRRDMPQMADSALTDRPAALRSSFSLIIFSTSISGINNAQNQRHSGQGDGNPEQPIVTIVLDGMDQIKDRQKVNAEAMR